jgi:hypothetical protein
MNQMLPMHEYGRFQASLLSSGKHSKVDLYATSHSSSNMVILVAVDLQTRKSQPVAVKLSLESLILGCSILIPISSAQICGSFF